MRNFRFIVGRNLNLFLQNKLNVLLSWFSVLIVLSLYFVFLRDFLVQMVSNQGVSAQMCELVSDRFMVAGLLVVVSTTTCFGTIQQRVKDKESGIFKDYLTAPVSKLTLTMGSVTSTGLVSSAYTIVTFIFCEFYFYYRHESELTTSVALQVMGTLILACFVNALLLFIISEFISNTTDFSTFGNLYGTIVGFLAGAYLPYFFYGDWLKNILFYLPCTQLTSIMRKLFTENIVSVLGVEKAKILSFQLTFGIELEHDNSFITKSSQYGVVLIEALGLLLIVVALSKWRRQER